MATSIISPGPQPGLSNLDLPLTQNQCIKCGNWMNNHFGEKFTAAVENTPFEKEILYAIACQETAIFWQG